MAIVGAVVGFSGSQLIDHSPSLAADLARVNAMMRGQTASQPATSPATTSPAPAAPAVDNNAGAGSNPAAATNPSNPGGRITGRRGNPGSSTNPAPASNGNGANPAPAANGNGANPATATNGNGGNPATATNGNGGRPAPAANTGNPAPAANAGTPASDPDQAAIQQAIQTIDAAQVTAVTNQDTSGLANGAATSDFAAQQQSDTQDLLNNGVTAIKLVNIEWGPITVNGNTATATAFETWGTTYSDSSTDQARDRNVYTLVQNNGTWQVQSDQHPDDAATAQPTGLQGIPGIPNNLLPPGLPNPLQNPAPAASTGGGNPATATNGNGGNPATATNGNGGRPAPASNGNGGRPAPAANTGNPAPAANAGTPASDPDQAAIQQAIQTIDTAQVTAVTNQDTSGLANGSATSDFAAQQQSDTQDLLNNGVTAIKLVNIEWGPITVNGNTATATAFETWGTTYSDSSTDQARDRNVYTLVQNNGTWQVQSDQHPDDAATAQPTGLQGIPGIPNNLLPPGFPNPLQNPAPRGQGGSQPRNGNGAGNTAPANGNTAPPVQVQP
jgi:hypothetical protein